MKTNYSHIAVILDRSGSMSSVKEATIAGFNDFLDKQKKTPGEATISLHQFDDVYETVYDFANLQYAPLLNETTYQPRNSTALLDAIGKTINNLGVRLGAMTENERPERIIVVIQTDGYENASKEYTKDKINELIIHQRDKYNWQFLFLGANQDAIMTASSIGIQANKSMTYDHSSVGTSNMYMAASNLTSSLRICAVETMEAVEFSEYDKKKQEDLLKTP
ncbi:MAG: VWA domain-containing protein [bacterium]|nr:VWA domain-containing protein [bacterium]